MATAARRLYSPDEYLTLERNAEYKSEYFRGEIFAMAGASVAHITIVSNLNYEFTRQLKGRPCRSLSNDLRVRVSDSGMISYPDLTVACPPLDFVDHKADTLLNPRVIVEVLSKTTESFDRGEKWLAYREIPSLTDYILVSQDRTLVERFARQPDGRWLHEVADTPESVIEVPSIECSLRLADVYDKVDFTTQEPLPLPDSGP